MNTHRKDKHDTKDLILCCITCKEQFTREGFETHLSQIDDGTICYHCHSSMEDAEVIFDRQPSEYWGAIVYENVPTNAYCPSCGEDNI